MEEAGARHKYCKPRIVNVRNVCQADGAEGTLLRVLPNTREKSFACEAMLNKQGIQLFKRLRHEEIEDEVSEQPPGLAASMGGDDATARANLVPPTGVRLGYREINESGLAPQRIGRRSLIGQCC